ncbi:glutamate racemase, partial [Actinomadura geliboluensis]
MSDPSRGDRLPDAPIGIFDSGFGGLTVARAILDQLPNEPIVYLGDSARQPYGPRPIAEVRAFALEMLDRLVDEGVKMLVIACNSASSAMLRDARERYDVPVVEVINPATRRAARATSNGRVGLIATQATVTSRAYDDAFAAAPHIELVSAACPRFVEFVEAGVTMGGELLEAARGYLRPIVDAGCDTLILGCTHYPLLTGVISYVVGDGVTLVSSADETAKDVYRVLHDRGLARAEDSPRPRHRFRATGDPAVFAELGRRFLGPEIGSVETTPAGAAPDGTPDGTPDGAGDGTA